MQITVQRVRHRWSERAGFVLNRPRGTQDYVLLHFLSPVELRFSGQAFHADKGSLIVFSPHTPHGFDAQEPLLHDWIRLTGDVAEMMNEYALKTDTLYQLDESAMVSEIIALMESEFFAQRPYCSQLLQLKLNEMFIRLSHAVNHSQPKLRVSSEIAEHLREMRMSILAAPWRPWSVAELAQRVSLSQSRLHALYKAVFGISPRQDLILIRIEKAKTLLQNGASVASAAEQLGYSNVYHFIRQFKQVTGTTPGLFAKHL